jgi:hypothetical protein
MESDDLDKLARGLTSAHLECLALLPCPITQYLPSVSFYLLGLHEIRKRFWLFGPLWIFPSPLGLAVKAHIERNEA